MRTVRVDTDKMNKTEIRKTYGNITETININGKEYAIIKGGKKK